MSSKFIKGDHKEKPKVSTAALPDIVFMLLFYFMVAASIKSSNYENFVEVDLPNGKDLTQVADQNLVNYIYVGIPVDKGRYGNQANLIVADDRIIQTNEIRSLVDKWRGKVPPENYGDLQTMLSIHKHAKLNVVQEIEDALGAAKLPKILYSGAQGPIERNFQ